MKIIGTGLSGLVGSRLVELLSDEFDFDDLSRETHVDITNYPRVTERIATSPAPWVFHLAAATDVDGAEKERSLGEKSQFWVVNVAATENIVNTCRDTGKRLLYISTDYVFDGTRDFYTEEDMPNPQGWYAITKYEGEKCVGQLESRALIVRIANPYWAHPVGKLDFVAKIRERLSQGQGVKAPSDQLFVPTFIDDIAQAIRVLVKQNAFGIYHVVGGDALSPYQAAQLIARTFTLPETLVAPTSFAEFFAGRAPRPFRAVLKHDKIDKLGIKMHDFGEGLTIIKEQLANLTT